MADSPAPVAHPDKSTKKQRSRRVKIWAWVLLGLGLALFVTLEIVIHRAEPILKARVIDTLSTRFDSRVELDQFHISIWHGLEVSGGGLKLYPNALDAEKPLIAVDKFSFHTSWVKLLRTPMHIGHVHIEGLQLNMPPKQQRKNIPKLKGGKQHKIKIFVGEMLIDNARLVLGTNKPGKVPLVFDISHAQLDSIGAGQPLKFHALLLNAKPIGDIDSSGYFGPFQEHSPGDTQIKGTYDFTHADLSTTKGIAGTLSSTGKYEGTLNNITVDGETDTPNFSIDVSGHPVPLHTTFHAIVDGTNGDTYLQPVNAEILHSHLVAVGKVISVPGKGHHIVLDVVVAPASIQDMLQLGVRTEPPVMTGDLKMKTKLDLPPGKLSVADKLRLRGSFEVLNAHFTNDKVQSKIDDLSLRSQGKPKEAKAGNEAPVQSDMKGQFQLANSKLTLTGLVFTVPGTKVTMDGIYSLDGNQFDFHGHARLDAKVSQMVTGWKSLLLKPVDPFLSKNGAGTEVPIKVTGTKSAPKFGLDFGHKDDKNKNDKNGK